MKDQLTQARERDSFIDRDMVMEVVTVVLTTMSGDLTATETSLLGEIESLGRTIAAAKEEIAALKVDDIRDRDIPFATDELDAIVQHTAVATNAILESCEMLDEVAVAVSGDTAVRLQDAVTKIYEACSFQDITGQRITKVVTTLKAIESKVAQIILKFGVKSEPGEACDPATAVISGTVELLNGPQLPSNAMDQSDIDKLLASFG
ncbi:MAG: protein phosphatase CheZ [Acetobacteraceae bacterium]|jgi:chemotaxis protein CheZ